MQKLTCPTVFPRTSLKRSRTRTRKDCISMATDVVCPPSCSSTLSRRKTRPPPLQIIPELSENELGFDASPNHSPATARPTQFAPQQPQLDSSRLTLSAFSFSIDDALLMFGDNAPRSPALSTSSSTSGVSSEDVLATPGASDDEDACDFVPPTPRLRLQHIPIRPLCVTKTQSLIRQEDEDTHSCSEKEEEKAVALPLTEVLPEVEPVMPLAEETAREFYTCEFQDFISLSPLVPSYSSPARRDSFTLANEVLPNVVEVLEPKPRGHSRHSKPLPLLPPATLATPFSPSVSPLVRITAHTSMIRRKRNIPPPPSYPPPPPPIESRPLPRMGVPLDIEDCTFFEDFDVPSRGSTVGKLVHDAEQSTNIYSRPSLVYTPSASIRPLPPAIPETLLVGMCTEATLPRSSIDSTSSSTSSSSGTLAVPSSFPDLPSFFEGHESEATERLRSRWSSSTLGSQVSEPPRTGTLFSPLRNVFGSRMRRVPLQKTPPQTPSSKHSKNKHGSPATPSPPSTSGKHVRQGSRSSTSSAGTSSSESEGYEASPSGLKRKPIPLAIFLRAT